MRKLFSMLPGPRRPDHTEDILAVPLQPGLVAEHDILDAQLATQQRRALCAACSAHGSRLCRAEQDAPSAPLHQVAPERRQPPSSRKGCRLCASCGRVGWTVQYAQNLRFWLVWKVACSSWNAIPVLPAEVLPSDPAREQEGQTPERWSRDSFPARVQGGSGASRSGACAEGDSESECGAVSGSGRGGCHVAAVRAGDASGDGQADA